MFELSINATSNSSNKTDFFFSKSEIFPSPQKKGKFDSWDILLFYHEAMYISSKKFYETCARIMVFLFLSSFFFSFIFSFLLFLFLLEHRYKTYT